MVNNRLSSNNNRDVLETPLVKSLCGVCQQEEELWDAIYDVVEVLQVDANDSRQRFLYQECPNVLISDAKFSRKCSKKEMRAWVDTQKHPTEMETTESCHTSKKRSLVCEICSTTFKDKISLVAHQRRHQQVLEYMCLHSECDFLEEIDLRRHIAAWHMNDWPHTCTVCQSSFFRVEIVASCEATNGITLEIACTAA
ncbi:zinc finger protein 449 [Drosophila serrata]|uniref:zinc finger protein 449 n=1 Tax=Drosophila serrata TaxID=7274 RepID=UPI000A1D0256|nr:zinc finger protein 449 [Drosophila serrata]